MTISLRLTEQEAKLFKSYADMKNISMSELVRQAVLDRIEDEIDLKAYNKAMEEYERDPETFSHDEVRRMLDL